MSSAQFQHPIHSLDEIRIDVLSRDLKIPITAILQSAADGMIPLYFSTFPHNYTCLTVHKQRIDSHHDTQSKASKEVKKNKKTNNAEKSEVKTSIDSIGMPIEKIEGVVLSQEDCHQLILHKRLSQRLFPAVMIKDLAGYNIFPAIRGPGLKTPPSEAKQWMIACYDKDQMFDPNSKQCLPTLISFDIKPWQLSLRGEDVHRLVHIVFNSATSILPILHLDKDTNLVDVATNRPAYFSEKLNYLIEASERFWRTKTPIDASEYDNRHKKVLAMLGRDDFESLFVKEKLHTGTQKAAAKFIRPVFARDKAHKDLREEWTGYISPELCKLMAAAKLFWGSPDVVLDEVLTHPKKEDIEAYFRAVGISGNDASAAVTLIRPEAAARGGNGTSSRKPEFTNPFKSGSHKSAD